jgi:hypothetical protein
MRSREDLCLKIGQRTSYSVFGLLAVSELHVELVKLMVPSVPALGKTRATTARTLTLW